MGEGSATCSAGWCPVTLAELLAAATPGPWRHGYDDGSGRAGEDNWRGRETGGGYITQVGSEDEKGLPFCVVSGGEDSWSLPQGVERKEDARLIALAPDLARLALDMGEALRMVRNELWEQQERDAPPHGYKRKEALIESADSVLARLDGIANKDKTT